MNHLAPGPMILEFRLGPIPVRIHIWFVFVALLLGLGAQRGITRVVAWAIGFLFTVFAHELSHAIAARSFGAPAQVHLTLVRPGLASRVRLLSPYRRVLVCLAGPVASVLIAGLAFALSRVVPSTGEPERTIRYLAWLNLGWGVLNLVPILPLD